MSCKKSRAYEALTPRIAKKMKIEWALSVLSDLKDLVESAEIPDKICFLEDYRYGTDRRKVTLHNIPDGIVLTIDINQFEGSIYYRQYGQPRSVLIIIPRYKGKQRNIEFASPYFNLKHKEPDMGMEFDKSKILTAVTADQAKEGDLGWVSDTFNSIKIVVERGGAPKEIIRVLPDDYTHRFKTDINAYSLFYPAPYSYLQERWVKENGLLKESDYWGVKVRVTRQWDISEFDRKCLVNIGDEFRITSVDGYGIMAVNDSGIGDMLPYFAIEIVKEEPKPQYRPFASAEEFKPHRDKWFIFKQSDVCVRFGVYTDELVYHGGEDDDEAIDYADLLRLYTFEDGTPAGVKL